MQKAKASLLLHPFFIACLVVLVWNDAYGKYAYPGMLTGKLSDVTGLIVLPVCCRVLFPNQSKKTLLLACSLFFIWWKSPLSQPLLQFLNEGLALPVQRVVDYTDLVALSMVPLAGYIRPRTWQLPPLTAFCLRWTLGFVAFFSLCSTSVYRGLFQANPLMDDVYFGKSFVVKAPASGVLRTLAQKGIAYHLDSVMYYPISNQDRLYYKAITGDSVAVWQPVSAKADSQLYVKWQGMPYYLIPEYQLADKSLQNIRFTLSENRKKTRTTITIQLFKEAGWNRYQTMDNKTRSVYQNIFISLFSPQ